MVLLVLLAFCQTRKPGLLRVWGLTLASAQESGAVDGVWYVAVNGDDTWSGSMPRANVKKTDGPFATIKAACKAARKRGMKQKKKIIVQEGQYFFDEPLVLTEEDTGLVIESAPGARVCIYGGRRVTGWRKDGEKFYSAKLSGVENFCSLARLRSVVSPADPAIDEPQVLHPLRFVDVATVDQNGLSHGLPDASHVQMLELIPVGDDD